MAPKLHSKCKKNISRHYTTMINACVWSVLLVAHKLDRSNYASTLCLSAMISNTKLFNNRSTFLQDHGPYNYTNSMKKIEWILYPKLYFSVTKNK